MELYQGDCLELMKEIQDESVDMILCDLPYGTTGSNGIPSLIARNYGNSIGESFHLQEQSYFLALSRLQPVCAMMRSICTSTTGSGGKRL